MLIYNAKVNIVRTIWYRRFGTDDLVGNIGYRRFGTENFHRFTSSSSDLMPAINTYRVTIWCRITRRVRPAFVESLYVFDMATEVYQKSQASSCDLQCICSYHHEQTTPFHILWCK